ncbi:MAG: class I SAM-dependent methyltransferase [Thermodesulfovibrio sp.]|nr:class I SAM-dependent methyltransferase [Thermodesulfovibrio sp.]
MKKKHEGYQDYILSNKSWFEKFIEKNFKYSTIKKLYFTLSRVAIFYLRYIPNISVSKYILDIGCGPGESLDYIKRYVNSDAELFGIDLDRNKNLSEFVNFFQVDVDENKLPFHDSFFDIVISTFVLEHLKNPQKLFTEVKRVLKNRGYFYCVTENYTSIFLPGKFNFYSDPTHVRPWTKESLKALAQMCGFEVIKIGHFRPIEFFLLIPFVPILNWIFRLKSSFVIYEAIFGKSIYCILKKP